MPLGATILSPNSEERDRDDEERVHLTIELSHSRWQSIMVELNRIAAVGPGDLVSLFHR